jgi:hypothetical protein
MHPLSKSHKQGMYKHVIDVIYKITGHCMLKFVTVWKMGCENKKDKSKTGESDQMGSD